MSGALPGAPAEPPQRLRDRRAELARLGGRLTVNGVPGEGTTVDVIVPRVGGAA
jgi:hypothetical protein